jgi:hypothetical protein
MEDIFKNPQTLAHAVKDIASVDLTPRPYNRFEPDKTVWWLVRSTDWPAYKYGKLFFDMGKEIPGDPDNIYCGFYIEKGLDPELRKLYPPSLIMERDWLWSEFIDSICQKDKKVYSILSTLVSSPFDVFLMVKTSFFPTEKASYFDTPENFLAQKDDFKSSLALFSIDKALELAIKHKEINPRNRDVAQYFEAEIVSEKQLSNLASKILAVPQLNWLWFDFGIGVALPKRQDIITPAKLWKKYLEPWASWLRKS